MLSKSLLSKSFSLKSFFLVGFVLLSGCASGLRADPIFGPAVVQNGLRFESWLAHPKIAIPNQTGKNSTVTRLLSVRVTNLRSAPVRFNPFAVSLTLIKPSGKEVVPDPILIAGSLHRKQEQDYLILDSGQSIVLPEASRLYWSKNNLCFSWPSPFDGHPCVYQRLSAGTYRFALHCDMPRQAVALYDDHTGKLVKALNGFWTGALTLPIQRFDLTLPQSRLTPLFPKRKR